MNEREKWNAFFLFAYASFPPPLPPSVLVSAGGEKVLCFLGSLVVTFPLPYDLL